MSIIGKKIENAKKHNGQILEHNRLRLTCHQAHYALLHAATIRHSALSHMCTLIVVHIGLGSHTYTHVRTHMHTHMRAHAHTRTHTHTHTHTHTELVLIQLT